MDFKFPYKNYKPKDLIRRCGYAQIIDPKTSQISFVKRLGSGFYPRFHVYLNEFDNYFEVSLHLDQKQPRYQGQTAHSADYQGEVVEAEARRITAQISSIYHEG